MGFDFGGNIPHPVPQAGLPQMPNQPEPHAEPAQADDSHERVGSPEVPLTQHPPNNPNQPVGDVVEENLPWLAGGPAPNPQGPAIPPAFGWLLGFHELNVVLRDTFDLNAADCNLRFERRNNQNDSLVGLGPEDSTVG